MIFNRFRQHITPVIGETNLFVNRRIRFSPVRNFTIVNDKHGRRILVCQTQFEYFKSAAMNKQRISRRNR